LRERVGSGFGGGVDGSRRSTRRITSKRRSRVHKTLITTNTILLNSKL
jgi:hypothetical protein